MAKVYAMIQKLRRASKLPNKASALTSYELLAQAHIPSPESLMAQLVAFKIAQMPASTDTCGYSQQLIIKLADGRRLEVRCECPPSTNQDSASVGLPGGQLLGDDSPYRSVKLSDADQQVILEQFRALVERSHKLRDHEAACESQDNALHILEGLI